MEHVALQKTPGSVPPLESLRQAEAADVDRIYGHLLRLSTDDRSLRFCGAVRDLTLRRQAEAVAAGYPAGLIACSHEPDAPVRGMIEIARIVDWAEIALSVEDDWRGLGLAPGLIRGAARWARTKNIRVLEALTLPENGAMRGLGRKLGARSRADDGMIRMRFDVDDLLRDETPSPVPVSARPAAQIARDPAAAIMAASAAAKARATLPAAR